MAKLWVGVDIGKTDHHLVAVNADGRIVYGARVPNDETALLTAISHINQVGKPVCWAVDVTTSLAALLLTLLWQRGTTEYASAAKLAAHAGLAPVSRDSGAITGNHRGPRRFHRPLRQLFWMAAFTAIRTCPTSRAYYDKKRAEGKDHHRALLALARRRINVLWVLIRDHTTFNPPTAAQPAAQSATTELTAA